MMAQPNTLFQNGTYIEYKSNSGNSAAMEKGHRAGSGRATNFVAEQLLQAIICVLELEEDAVFSERTVPWSSATFDGMRYTWVIVVAGLAARRRAENFCKLASERDWPLRGAFVADLSGSIVDNRLTIEVLTVMEC